jgi:hypothetical protein
MSYRAVLRVPVMSSTAFLFFLSSLLGSYSTSSTSSALQHVIILATIAKALVC